MKGKRGGTQLTGGNPDLGLWASLKKPEGKNSPYSGGREKNKAWGKAVLVEVLVFFCQKKDSHEGGR